MSFNSRFCIAYIFSSSFLLFLFPASVTSASATLDSIEILKTHKWLSSKPKVYFQCSGGNKTIFPDVEKFNVSYTFNGEESWQPLVEFTDTKCKRCGFYESGLVSDDVLDEWEFCPSDFNEPNAKYVHFKEKQLNATFLCAECMPSTEIGKHFVDEFKILFGGVFVGPMDHGKRGDGGLKGTQLVMVIGIFVSVSIVVFIVGLVAGMKYWQKRKREQEKARFMRLFEEDDEFDKELGLGPLEGFT
ncbi:uncharacterized protein LOC124943096 [Impatiens glandulifera]|uniref:uncharacterized protein LOC124943096 n=1 Tax=Impatiens glandulifera TaxID=253017 RepID=UPI001FB0D113|nr:uncharacterized protein LOC124943096 [Impatiens glandulifera]